LVAFIPLLLQTPTPSETSYRRAGRPFDNASHSYFVAFNCFFFSFPCNVLLLRCSNLSSTHHRGSSRGCIQLGLQPRSLVSPLAAMWSVRSERPNEGQEEKRRLHWRGHSSCRVKWLGKRRTLSSAVVSGELAVLLACIRTQSYCDNLASPPNFGAHMIMSVHGAWQAHTLKCRQCSLHSHAYNSSPRAALN
jgi:hypothetical protein